MAAKRQKTNPDSDVVIPFPTARASGKRAKMQTAAQVISFPGNQKTEQSGMSPRRRLQLELIGLACHHSLSVSVFEKTIKELKREIVLAQCGPAG